MNFPSAIELNGFWVVHPRETCWKRGGADSVQPNYRRENAQKLLAQCKHLFGLGLEDNAVSYKQIQPAHLTQKLWKALKYLDVIAVKSRFCWKTKTFSVQTHTAEIRLSAACGSRIGVLGVANASGVKVHEAFWEKKTKADHVSQSINRNETQACVTKLQRQAPVVAKMAQLDLAILAARTMIAVGLFAAITVVFV